MFRMRKLKGKYYGRLRFNGKEKLLPLNTSNKLEAERLLKIFNEKEAKIKAGLLDRLENEQLPTLIEAIQIYLIESKNKGLEKNTVNHYGYALKHLSNIFNNNMGVNKISDSDFIKLKTFLLNKFTNSRATVNSYLKSINTFFSWVEKKYRIEELDHKIRKGRTRKEYRLMRKLQGVVNVPRILEVNESEFTSWRT